LGKTSALRKTRSVRAGVVSSRANAADKTFGLWKTTFCQELGVDPWLQGPVERADPVLFLQVFVHRYRTGVIAPKGNPVRSRTVEDGLSVCGTGGLGPAPQPTRQARLPYPTPAEGVLQTGSPATSGQTDPGLSHPQRPLRGSRVRCGLGHGHCRHGGPRLLLPPASGGIYRHKIGYDSILRPRCPTLDWPPTPRYNHRPEADIAA
jgi:hypothetical protein